MDILVLALVFLLQNYGLSFCQNGTRPNIVMVMSDAFVSMDEVTVQCFIYCLTTDTITVVFV